MRGQPWLGPRAAYVHVPFCRTKCLYCDFNTYAGKERLIGEYVAALGARDRARARVRAPVRCAASSSAGAHPPCCPSRRRAAPDGRLAAQGYGVAPGAEVTLEANPGTFGPRYLEGLLAAGVNRLSLGVQSLDDETLRRLARTHNAAHGDRGAVRLARRAGRALGQPRPDLRPPLADARRLARRSSSGPWTPAPDHVSLYALMVEEGTPLATLVARGTLDGAGRRPGGGHVRGGPAAPGGGRLRALRGLQLGPPRARLAPQPGLLAQRGLPRASAPGPTRTSPAGAPGTSSRSRATSAASARREGRHRRGEPCRRRRTLGETAALALRLRQEGHRLRRFGERFGDRPPAAVGPGPGRAAGDRAAELERASA